MENAAEARSKLLAILAVVVTSACSAGAPHSAQDYAKAIAARDPEGTFTTIAGPATAIVQMRSTLRFPDGTTRSGERSVLMYYRPSPNGKTCLFQIGHAANRSSEIVKEDVVERPCDGIHWARFHIAGSDIAFIAHLTRTDYKGTPVTLLEIGEHRVPATMHVVY